MWSAFYQMENNLGVSFEWAILIVFLIGGGIFCANNFQIGMILYFVGSGCLFMMFYALGLNYTPALIIFFMSLVIMSLTLYANGMVAQKGGLT
jgi:hypothetical protein